MLLKFLLFVQILHVVNQDRFKWIVTGIPGIVPTNLLFVAVLLLMRGKHETVTAKPILRKALLLFYGALTLALLRAMIQSPGDLIDDFTYYKNALFFPLFYILFLKCRQDEKTTRWLIIWVLVVAAVAGLQGLRQGMDYGFGHYNPMKRASGPFGADWRNANRAGVFYGMFMPMFVALFLFLKRRKLWRLAALGACIATAGGAISTYSRQSYFLVLLAIAVLLLRKNIILAVVVSIASVSLVGYLPESATQRVQETKQQGKPGSDVDEVDESTASRWELWAGGMRMLSENRMGVGLNRWKRNIGKYCNYELDAHNFYVLTLCECGPLGLATLLYLIYTLFVLARWVRVNRPPDDTECTALTLGFTVCTLNMALGSIYGSPTLEGGVMAPYWALCGLLERYTHLKMRSSGEEPKLGKSADSMAERFPLAAYIAPGRK